MKKKIIAMVGLTMVLAAFTGCKAETPTPAPTPDEPTNIGTEDLDVAPIAVKDLKFEDGKIIFTTENTSKVETTYGEAYRIDVAQDDATWKDTELTKDMAFIEISHIIAANDKSENTVDISQFEFEPGQYRVVRDYTHGEHGYEIRVEFTVDAEKNITPAVSSVSMK